MSENTHLVPCGFLKLFHLNFNAFRSKLDIATKVLCFKNAEDNSIIFFVGIINISYLKAHFKSTTTIFSTNLKMNFIFDEWIIDQHIASNEKEKISKLKAIH